MIHYLVSFLLGFLGHKFRPITDTFPPRWSSLSNHVIGVILVFMGMPLTWRYYSDADDGWKRLSATFWTSALFVGIGNAIAWLMDDTE